MMIPKLSQSPHESDHFFRIRHGVLDGLIVFGVLVTLGFLFLGFKQQQMSLVYVIVPASLTLLAILVALSGEHLRRKKD